MQISDIRLIEDRRQHDHRDGVPNGVCRCESKDFGAAPFPPLGIEPKAEQKQNERCANAVPAKVNGNETKEPIKSPEQDREPRIGGSKFEISSQHSEALLARRIARLRGGGRVGRIRIAPQRQLFDASAESFFFNDTATTEIYTLSLHDALPI